MEMIAETLVLLCLKVQKKVYRFHKIKMSNHFQDWEPVVINIPKTRPGQNAKKATNSTQSDRVPKKKSSNTQSKASDNSTKIEKADEAKRIETVSIDIARTIQQRRTEKKWTQKELATKICEQHRVISDYEAGRAIPNNQVLVKLERVLEVKLRGSNKNNKNVKILSDHRA